MKKLIIAITLIIISFDSTAQIDSTVYIKENIVNISDTNLIFGLDGGLYFPIHNPPFKYGTEEDLSKFIQSNIVYPKSLDTSGTVYVKFTIDTIGK